MKGIQTEIVSGYNADVKPMEATPNQELILGRMSRLIKGAIYLFPAQVFHTKKSGRSPTGYANRAVCYEFTADGTLNAIKTLSYSALRALYLGYVTEDYHIPMIKSEFRDGLIRPKKGMVNYISNIKGGEAPVEIRDLNGIKTIVIAYPFALRVTGRADFFTTVLNRREDGKYDMAVDPNGNLAIAIRNDYEFEYVVPSKEMLESVTPQKDVPELEEYFL